MRIDSSIVNLQASRRLSEISQAISRSLNRLATGRRVSSPRDDVVGYSLSVGLNSQIRGLGKAVENINQASGALQTAHAGISTLLDLTSAMREIALQGSSSTLSSSERAALQTRLEALMEEYDQIVHGTSFNGIGLLNGEFGSRTLQTGANSGDDLDVHLDSLLSSEVFERQVGSGFQDVYEKASGGYTALFADTNGDGNLDIVSIGLDSYIRVALGDGAGNFAADITSALEADFFAAEDLRLADFNEDGILDVLFGSSDFLGNGGEYEVLIGNGDGTFTSSYTFDPGTNAGGFELGDVNGDGHIDIVDPDSDDGSIDIWYGDGKGDFKLGDSLTLDSSFTEINLSDINGDGALDILYYDLTNNDLELYFSDGVGGFQSVVTYNGLSSTPKGSIATGDYDNDGDLDIYVTAGSNVMRFENLGAGQLDSYATYNTGHSNHGIVLTDHNLDGYLDLVTSNQNTRYISLHLGDGAGSFAFQASFNATNNSSLKISAGDVNGDGVDDIIAESGTTQSYAVFISETQRATARNKVSVEDEEKSKDLIDILDRVQDQLLSSQSEVSIYLNQLEIRASSNLLLSENLQEAQSKIIDTDFALETAELVRLQILQQAQIAVIAQGNLQMQLVLELINDLK